MPTNTTLPWEKRLIGELLEVMREQGKAKLEHDGPEPYMTKSDLLRFKHCLDEVKSAFEQEFGPKVKKDPRSMWPFNDHTVKLSPMFEAVFMEIKDNYELKPRGDAKIKAAIKNAGGRPYDKMSYGPQDLGDAVVQPDTQVIGATLGKSKRTVEREIGKMVKAGIIVPLKTARNEPSLYVIGTLGQFLGGNLKVNYFINATSRRDEIRKALEDL